MTDYVLRVAIVVISSSPTLAFNFRDALSPAFVTAGLEQLQFVPGEPTAVSRALDLITDVVFDPLNGFREAESLVISFTGGQSSDTSAAVASSVDRLIATHNSRLLATGISATNSGHLAELLTLAAGVTDNIVRIEDLENSVLSDSLAVDFAIPRLCEGTSTTSQPFSTTPSPVVCNFRRLDVVFILDTTGAEADFAIAKSLLIQIVNRLPLDQDLRYLHVFSLLHC